MDEVREALRTACNDWVKAFLIEALIEQSVSEEFVMEREGLEYRFVPCALTPAGTKRWRESGRVASAGMV